MGPLLVLLLLGGVAFLASKANAAAPPGTAPKPLPSAPPGTPAAPGQVPAPNAPQAPAAPPHPETVDSAVAVALQLETDPAKLAEFAASLLPDYPNYSAQLAARAALLAYQPPAPPAPPAPAPSVTPPGPAVIPVLPPAPVAFPGAGSTAYVNTQENGPNGYLNVRDQPSTGGTILSKVSRGSSLVVTGPDSSGWLQIITPGRVVGYASSAYLAAAPPSDAAQPTVEVVS